MASPLESLQHTAARAAAMAMTDVIIAILRPEEVSAFMTEAYAVILAALQTYESARSKLTYPRRTTPMLRLFDALLVLMGLGPAVVTFTEEDERRARRIARRWAIHYLNSRDGKP